MDLHVFHKLFNKWLLSFLNVDVIVEQVTCQCVASLVRIRAGGRKLYKVRSGYRHPAITQLQDHLCACTIYNHIRYRKYSFRISQNVHVYPH